MESICEFANESNAKEFLHPVVRAVILHFLLAYGHPFEDGNGRTARALFYWSMRRQGSGGGGPSWLTVIGHAKDSLWSVDLFRCESILLKTHWVLVVMDHFSRRIIGFAVQVGNVDGL